MNDLTSIFIVGIFIIIFFIVALIIETKDFVYNKYMFWCKLANSLGTSLTASSIVGTLITKNLLYLFICLFGIGLIYIDICFNPHYLDERQIKELEKALKNGIKNVNDIEVK